MTPSRARYLALVTGTVVTGLLVNRRGGALSPVVRDVLGDALWAAMVLWALSAIAPVLSLRWRAAGALAISWAVELSQLVHVPALDAARRTTLGQLALGTGFDPRDFAAYAAGVLAAVLIDGLVVRRATGGTRKKRGIVMWAGTVLVSATMSLALTASQQSVTFTTPDNHTLAGQEYGSGPRGVVLVAHGGYSQKETWEKQARLLAQAGFRVVAFDTRAGVELRRTGKETDCLYDPACLAIDVLSAVRYLRSSGATTVAVIGGSAGGGAVAHASVDAKPGEIDRIVLLAPMAIAAPEKMQARKLFVVARDDANSSGPRLPGIRQQYEKASDPKQLIVLEGSAHGQRVFDTPGGDALMREILRFLSAR